jgi:uncharacterized Zn-binding protein involved in type VI secretion
LATVAIHPPKTPVHKGIHSVAKATIPNICKMPGPPAPFVPAPLPNIAKSELSPKGYSTTVEIEGNAVAIRGATYESIGDMASKGTGGGLISANCHGPAKFIAPGSMTVKIEGKNVHLLGDPMLNNCGPSGSPPNTGATMMGGGTDHAEQKAGPILKIKCEETDLNGNEFSPCQIEEICAKIAATNREIRKPVKEGGGLKKRKGSVKKKQGDAWVQRKRGNEVAKELSDAALAGNAEDLGFHDVSPECQEELRNIAEQQNYEGFSADHVKEVAFVGGLPVNRNNLRWMSSGANSWVGFRVTKRLPGKPKYRRVEADCCK